MFAPEYRISHKILTNLIGIELNRRMVDLAPLSAEWCLKLRQEAATRKAFSVLSFDGNLIDLNGVSRIVNDEPGRDDKAHEVALRTKIVAKERDVQQVLNWLNANRLVEQVAYLSEKFKQVDFGDKDLMRINILLGEKLIGSSWLGKFRSEDISGSALLDLPAAVEVPYQMDDLFLWIKSAGKSEMHPILKAAVVFHELLRIYPFAENNTISSVAFFDLMLANEGYGQKKLIVVEEELLKNKDNLNRILVASENSSGDLTVWLEQITKVIFEASEKTRVKVMNLVGDAPIFKTESGRVISLTERQIVIMEEMTVKNEMTIREIRGLLPMVSDDTILRDLKDLIDKKLVKKKGKTKGAVYLLGKVKGFR